MKSKLITCIFVSISIFFTNCSDTKGDLTDNQKDIQGSWTLTSTSGMISGSAHEFEPGTIVWKFDGNGTVTVINENTETSFDDSYDSGTYRYFVTQQNSASICKKSLIINNQNKGCMTIENNNLYLGDNFADGPNYYFQKQ